MTSTTLILYFSQIISAIVLYVIFLNTNEHMDPATMRICCSVVTGMGVLGTLVFLFLPSTKHYTESKRSHLENLSKFIILVNYICNWGFSCNIQKSLKKTFFAEGNSVLYLYN